MSEAQVGHTKITATPGSISLESRSPVEEIDEETWYYFLGVLPPVYMNRDLIIDGKPIHASFGFAEGAEPVTAFWSEAGGKYYRQLTNQMNPYAFG
jgi:hypothetical protein